ncbi:MAG: MCE family protein [Solirubrobacterales bacterium]|nr:MCE family protein [Solirubrobacterales bacterium]
MRRHRPRISNFWGGIIGLAVLVAACYLVFGGSLPFSKSPFVLKAVFTTETQLHIPSPVRIAGVDVGQVVSVTHISGSSRAGLVTMDINQNGLPIHANANARIRPRIFLEGNFYVDLFPGTPNAPSLRSGDTLPAAQNSGPVQLDRVLSTLNSSARSNLQTLLQGIGAALSAPPSPGQDATQDPSVRGLTGAQALNLSLKYSADAFKASAIVNQGLLGLQRNDLERVVTGNAKVFKALAASGNQLSSLVTTFNATMATLASRQQDLSQTISLLPPLLRRTQSADTALDASFGPTQTFAAALTPGVEQLGPTIDAAIPWIAQATQLVSPANLGGLLSDLTPAVQNTSAAITTTKALISAADQLARCFTHTVIPTGNEVISDPPFGTGQSVYQELFQSAVGLAGAAGNFDGNGRYVRASAGGGSVPVQTPPLPGNGALFGNAVLPPLGTRPAYPGKAPPIRSSVACSANPVPKLNNATTGAAP